jgi:hypothetical protein
VAIDASDEFRTIACLPATRPDMIKFTKYLTLGLVAAKECFRRGDKGVLMRSAHRTSDVTQDRTVLSIGYYYPLIHYG